MWWEQPVILCILDRKSYKTMAYNHFVEKRSVIYIVRRIKISNCGASEGKCWKSFKKGWYPTKPMRPYLQHHASIPPDASHLITNYPEIIISTVYRSYLLLTSLIHVLFQVLSCQNYIEHWCKVYMDSSSCEQTHHHSRLALCLLDNLWAIPHWPQAPY